MVRKLNYMKMVEAGAAHGMSGRSQRRAAQAEAEKKARKDLQGLSVPQAVKLLKKKRKRK